MTPFGQMVGRELRSAILPLESVSIVDYSHLDSAMRALLKNALFWVVPDPAIDAARDRALAEAHALAETIHTDGVRTQGISLVVDQARAEAILAMQELVDAVADAEPDSRGAQPGDHLRYRPIDAARIGKLFLPRACSACLCKQQDDHDP